MSNITEGRAKLEALANELKEAGSKGVAQKIMNIVNNYLYRSHVGVPQGPKKVKRASKKKDAPAKKVAAKKSEKAPAKPSKAVKAGKRDADKAIKAVKAVKRDADKASKEAAKPVALPPDMDFPANV